MAFVHSLGLPQRKRLRSNSAVENRPVLKACAPNVSRRTALSLSAAVAAGLALGQFTKSPADAAPSVTGGQQLLGEKIDGTGYGYSFQAPASGWSKRSATLSSGRFATIFVRDADKDSNISMVTTPVPGDFAKLSSFGTMDNILSTIIPPKKDNVEGELISSSTDTFKNAYIFEYTITTKGVKRHLLTVFSLLPGRYINSLTAQSKEEVWKEVEPLMRAVTNSFELKSDD